MTPAHTVRMGSRLRSAVLGVVALVAPAASAFSQAPPESLATIHGLECRLDGGAASVTFRVEGALGVEVLSTLESGLPVTFTHQISIVKKRALWFPRVLARRTIEVTARLDTLTGRYTLTRTAEGGAAETETTDRSRDMERWMTHVRDLALRLPEGAGDGLEVRVRTQYERTYLLFAVPWSLSALAEKECR